MQVIGIGGGIALGRIMASSVASSCLRVIAGELSRGYAWVALAIGSLPWLELGPDDVNASTRPARCMTAITPSDRIDQPQALEGSLAWG